MKDKPDRKDSVPPENVDFTLQDARARVKRSTWSFVVVMVIVFGIATWVLFQQEKEHEFEEDDEVAELMASLPTGTVSGEIVRPEMDLPTMPELTERSFGLATNAMSSLDPVRMAEAMGYMRLADEYLRLRELDKAEQHARQALALWPNMNAALRMLGVIYTQRGQFSQAITLLQAALQSDPFNAESFNNLAAAYMHQGMMDKAEDLLHSAIQIRPDYAVGVLNLGLLYLATGQYEAAAEYLAQAVDAMPNQVNPRNNLAVALLRLGYYDSARQHLLVIIDQAPETPAAYFNMAITYTLEKDYEEAMRWIHRGAQFCSPVKLTRYMADSDFEPLKENPEFQEILVDLYPDLPSGPPEL
jgi:tetratricopeptide (TPR) repeat protein